MSRTPPFGSATSGLGRFVRREILARRPEITGTVIGPLRVIDADATTSATWVVDVDIGGGVALEEVQVKAGGDGSRFYAALGQTVKLARNTEGLYDVIGPGDRVAAIAVKKTYNLDSATPLSTENVGRQAERVPYSFYQGPTPGTPGTSRWNDGVTPYPFVRIVDGDGVPV